MEFLKSLTSKLHRVGPFILIGIILIIYISFGAVYWQQGTQQTKLNEQIAKLSTVLAKPMPSAENLEAEYEQVNLALSPVIDSDAIAMLVEIASESGIDIDEAHGRFRVPSAQHGSTKIGSGTYQLVSFRNIHVQGDYASVMAFISNIDSGNTLDTMVLRRVTTRQIEATAVGEEGDRRAEFRTVTAAVSAMMSNNSLSEIPNPISSGGGVATNLMGDDPYTTELIEGFPDIATTAAEKGYIGGVTGAPRGGYVLYNHGKIRSDNATLFQTVDYITLESTVFYYTNNYTTHYYYTCDVDGTVHQYDGVDIATATEYLDSGVTRTETVVVVDIDIYTKS
ncbi:MAG: hypothetical protein PHN78_03815 [Dehalococcoidales bacterium]|nr:hypothetical protein [Dehalococcoidales bacterium]